MRCPVCTQNTPDSWQPWLVSSEGGGYTHGLRVTPGIEFGVPSEVSLDSMYCANDECRQLVIRVHETLQIPPGIADAEVRTTTWLARPRTTRRSLDSGVPEPFRTDYLEAASILDLSPRMSAVLSRRVLGDLLERYAGQTQFSLASRIDKVVAETSHPSYITENLHHFREIADFGAHTQRDAQAEIIDVGRDEAEWTLDILDSLFDYFIVAPERNRKIREAMDERIKNAGRKSLASPEEEDA
jgi:hypothetical protein